MVPRMATTMKNVLAPDVISTEVEKFFSRVRPHNTLQVAAAAPSLAQPVSGQNNPRETEVATHSELTKLTKQLPRITGIREVAFEHG